MACKRVNGARMGLPVQAGDNLTLIKGIGPRIAAQLQHQGILTFAQLAKLSAKDIAARVSGLSTRRITRENWIKQARKLAQKTVPLHTPPLEATSRFRQHYATFTVELLLDINNCVRRTRVTYLQNEVEKTWAGWEEQKLTDFFVRSAELHVPLLTQRSTTASETVLQATPEAQSLSAEMAHRSTRKKGLEGILDVNEMTTIDLASNLPRYSSHAKEPFHVRFVLDFSRVNATQTMPVYYTITIWAKKLGTGTREAVGASRGILEIVDKAPCLIEAVISSPGTYRLSAIVTLTQKSTTPSPHDTLRAWKEGSMFRVC